MADRALPGRLSHTHAALAADPVAAATADFTRVPELSQRPLAAGTGAFTILPGIALSTSPPKLLELMFHPPEVRMERNYRHLQPPRSFIHLLSFSSTKTFLSYKLHTEHPQLLLFIKKTYYIHYCITQYCFIAFRLICLDHSISEWQSELRINSFSHMMHIHTFFSAPEIDIFPISIYKSGEKWPTLYGSLQWYAAVCLFEEPPALFLSPELEADSDPSLNDSTLIISHCCCSPLSVSLLCFFVMFLFPPPPFFKPPLFWTQAQTSSLVVFRKWKWDNYSLMLLQSPFLLMRFSTVSTSTSELDKALLWRYSCSTSTWMIKLHGLCQHLWKYPVRIFMKADEPEVCYAMTQIVTQLQSPQGSSEQHRNWWDLKLNTSLYLGDILSIRCCSYSSCPHLPLLRHRGLFWPNTTAFLSCRKSSDASLMTQQTKCQALHYWWLMCPCSSFFLLFIYLFSTGH